MLKSSVINPLTVNLSVHSLYSLKSKCHKNHTE